LQVCKRKADDRRVNTTLAYARPKAVDIISVGISNR
jgi:hypothetical protein